MAEVIDKELFKYWELLDASQKTSIINMIKSFLQPSTENPRTSIEQYNKEIDEAMARIDAGNFLTHEEVVKQLDKW